MVHIYTRFAAPLCQVVWHVEQEAHAWEEAAERARTAEQQCELRAKEERLQVPPALPRGEPRGRKRLQVRIPSECG